MIWDHKGNRSGVMFHTNRLSWLSKCIQMKNVSHGQKHSLSSVPATHPPPPNISNDREPFKSEAASVCY